MSLSPEGTSQGSRELTYEQETKARERSHAREERLALERHDSDANVEALYTRKTRSSSQKLYTGIRKEDIDSCVYRRKLWRWQHEYASRATGRDGGEVGGGCRVHLLLQPGQIETARHVPRDSAGDRVLESVSNNADRGTCAVAVYEKGRWNAGVAGDPGGASVLG